MKLIADAQRPNAHYVHIKGETEKDRIANAERYIIKWAIRVAFAKAAIQLYGRSRTYCWFIDKWSRWQKFVRSTLLKNR